RQFVQGVGVAGFGLLTGCGRLPGQAQAPSRVPRVDVIGGTFDPTRGPELWIQEGLHEYGYVDGQNIRLYWRAYGRQLDQLAVVVDEVVSSPTDIIVVGGEPSNSAVKRATGTIPIVMGASIDPVRSGLVDSLAHPGGNVTGTDVFSAELSNKRLGLLKEALPDVARVAVPWNVANPALAPEWEITRGAAQPLGIELQSVELHGPDDFERAFAIMAAQRPDALLTLHDTLTLGHVPQIVDFTATHRIPALYAFRNFVDAGGLLSYGPDLITGFRRVGYFIDRILKGAKPGDLPVERPMRFELVINL